MKLTTLTMLYKTPCSTDRGNLRLLGEFTPSLYSRMGNAVSDGGIDYMFIPNEVGATSPADRVISEFGYEHEYDFAGVSIEELYNTGSYNEFLLAVEVFDIDEGDYVSVEGFVSALENASYDETAETDRLQSLAMS